MSNYRLCWIVVLQTTVYEWAIDLAPINYDADIAPKPTPTFGEINVLFAVTMQDNPPGDWLMQDRTLLRV